MECQVEKQRSKRTLTLLIGQSNADGLGEASEIPNEYLDFTGKFIYGLNADEFEQLDPERNTSFNKNEALFGIEISYLECRQRSESEEVYLIKWSKGGTALCATENDDDWNVNEEGEMYDQLLGKIDFCLNNLISDWEDPIIDEVVWIHGSFDASHEECAKNYEENLKELVNSLRAHLGYDVEFKITTLNNAHPSSFKNLTNDAKESVADDLPNVKIIKTNRLGTENDNVHFNSQGLIELGLRLAQD